MVLAAWAVGAGLVALKILPFLLEVHLFVGQLQRAPTAKALTGERLPRLSMALSILAGLGVSLVLLGAPVADEQGVG